MRSGHEHPFHSGVTAQQLIAARIAEALKPVLDALEAPATRDLAVRIRHVGDALSREAAE